MGSSHSTNGPFASLPVTKYQRESRRHRVIVAFEFALSALFLFVFAGCNDGGGDPTNLARVLRPDAPQTSNAKSDHGSPAQETIGDDTPDGEPPEGTYVPHRLLVRFKPGASQSDKDHSVNAAGAHVKGEIPKIGLHILELPPQASETAQARAFRQQPHIAFAELDQSCAPARVPDDPDFPVQWHLPRINAPSAWDYTTCATDVVIAFLDTGVDGTHPELAAKMVPGWNMYDNNSETSDVITHGTGVAGLAAALSNNDAGMTSVAWGAKIMPVRVCDSRGFGDYSVIANGLIWAADHGARIANISYEYIYNSAAVTSAAAYFQSLGGAITAPAGNSGTVATVPSSPYIMFVSALDQNDQVPWWSVTGNIIDVCAPGVSMLTTAPGGTYTTWDYGTSFAAPQVTGVVALMRSANPALTPQDVRNVLAQSADDLGPAGWDPAYGWGRVNASRAVAMAAAMAAPPPDTTPPTVSFDAPSGGSTVTGTVSVDASASDAVGVASASLYVDGTLFATDTNAPYSFAWDTSGVPNGVHSLELRASDAAGNIGSALVSVTVNNFVADTTPPTVAISSPVNGASINKNISITVRVSDNVGVTRVELYVDGAIKSTATAAPFTMTWNTRRADRGAHTLQCRAYDAAGNVGVSAPVTVYK